MQEILQQIPAWAFIAAVVAVVLFPQITTFARGWWKGGGVQAVNMADHLNGIATHVAVNCNPTSRDKCLAAIDVLRTELVKPKTTAKPVE